MRIGDEGEGWVRGRGSVRGCWRRWRVAVVWILCFEGGGMGEVRGDVRSWRCCWGEVGGMWGGKGGWSVWNEDIKGRVGCAHVNMVFEGYG